MACRQYTVVPPKGRFQTLSTVDRPIKALKIYLKNIKVENKALSIFGRKLPETYSNLIELMDVSGDITGSINAYEYIVETEENSAVYLVLSYLVERYES